MLRTALISLAVAVAGGSAASWLTEGFAVWTAEGARRLTVVEVPVAAPHAVLMGGGLTGRSLHAQVAGAGRATIVDFIYTRCPSVCQALGSTFQQLQGAIATASAAAGDQGVDADVGLLSISFDPAHDDASELQRYATLWRADARHWQVVTVPDPAQLQRLLDAWQVVVIDDGRGGYAHNAALLVLDEHGRLVRIFDETEGDTALAFARSLRRPGPAEALP